MVNDAADGQRVLWVGDAHSSGPWVLAERADRVVVLDTGDGDYPDREEIDGEIVIRAFSDGPPSDPYDVAVVAELPWAQLERIAAASFADVAEIEIIGYVMDEQETMRDFFEGVGTEHAAGVWEDMPVDRPKFRKKYAAKIKIAANAVDNGEAVGT